MTATRAILEHRPDPAEHPSWWGPLRIDVTLRWIEFEHARRLLDRLASLGARRVTVHTSRPGLWRVLDGHGGIVVRTGLGRSARAMAQAGRGPGRGDLLKWHGLDIPVRRASSKGGLGRRDVPSGGIKWLALLEVPTPSMTQNVLEVGKVDSMCVLSCDPRVGTLAGAAGLPHVRLWDAPTSSTAAPSLEREIRRALDELDPLFARAAGLGICRLAKQLARDHGRVHRWLADLQPEHVIMSSDQHRYGALAVSAADELGIPTLVVQHGFADHELGYLPLRATRVATIGQASQDWFVRHGTPPERIVVTGSPRFPGFQPFEPRSHRRVLVALNSNATPVMRGFVECARALADTGVRVVFRTHPGDRHLRGLTLAELLAQFGAESHPHFELDHRVSVAESLAGVDAVLNWDSTVLHEALCLGVPVALYDTPGRPNPLRGAGLPLFEEPAALLELLGPAAEETRARSEAVRDLLVEAGGEEAARHIASLGA